MAVRSAEGAKSSGIVGDALRGASGRREGGPVEYASLASASGLSHVDMAVTPLVGLAIFGHRVQPRFTAPSALLALPYRGQAGPQPQRSPESQSPEVANL